MTAARWLLIAFLVASTIVCARLGFWQLDRLADKRAINVAMARARARPPIVVLDSLPDTETAPGHRFAITGHFDERTQVLLRGRLRGGEPGVEVVTPLVLADGVDAILVNRGWLPAPDGVTAAPLDFPEPDTQTVIGIVEARAADAMRTPMRQLPGDTPTLYSAPSIDPDSVAARVHYRLAPFVLRQLPGPGVPDRPMRTEPEPLGTFVHISYATQWFLFAIASLAAAAFVLHRGRPEVRG